MSAAGATADWSVEAFDATCGEPWFRIYCWVVRAAGVDLEVQVWACGVAGGADVADVLPGDDAFPGGDVDAVRPHVNVFRRDLFAADSVFDRDLSGVAIDHACVGDETIREGEDCCAVGGCPVGAGVQSGFAGDRVDPRTKR